TDNEWKILEGVVDSQYPVGDAEWDATGFRGLDAGGNLKEAGLTHWLTPNTGGVNTSGFTGLPGGVRYKVSGNFSALGQYGNFWSSTQYNSNDAWDRYLWHQTALAGRASTNYKENGYSIRCLKD
ncbi:MAG TPA: FISUMP domain-containing protein, partial [Bacteroidales bacterium]|nr:FISUMP domain-containing protein [Bacteroidales bacterium]